MEIEKKFLVKKVPEHLEQYEKREIEQGYLCTKPVVRIRKSNEDYILTYKNNEGINENLCSMASVCHEVELPLNKESYDHLKSKVDGFLVSKTRYLLPLQENAGQNLTAELDIFHNQLKGLVMVEVEFSDVNAMEQFLPPDWFGEEVSQDKRYSNSYLSTIKSYEQI